MTREPLLDPIFVGELIGTLRVFVGAMDKSDRYLLKAAKEKADSLLAQAETHFAANRKAMEATPCTT